MPKLSLTVYEDSTKATMIADWSGQAQDTTFETNEHGFSNLTAFIPMPFIEAERFYTSTPFAHVLLSDGAYTAFEGRIEDRRIIGGRKSGLEIGAYGYQNALRDIDYIGYWSLQNNYQDYFQVTSDDTGTGNRSPSQYVFDTNGRLWIALKEGQSYANGLDIGSFYMTILDNSENDLNGALIEFDYAVRLPTNWQFRTKTLAGMSTSGAVDDTITGTGSTLTGSKSFNGSQAGAYDLEFQVRNNTGGDSAPSGDTGEWFAKVENLRVRTAPSGTVSTMALYTDEIASGLVAFVNGLNSTQLSSSTALIETQSTDIPDLNVQARKPADVLTDLLETGDGATPPERLEWGVWEEQRLRLRARGQGRTWYVDAADIQIDSTVDEMYNSVQASYTDNRGRWRVTAKSDDSASQSKYGIVRRKIATFSSRTDIRDTTLVEEYRDVLLEDSKDITPRSKVTVNAIFDASGASYPLYMCRATDVLVIRNLPSGGGETVDKIRSVYVSRTIFDCDNQLLTPIPGLELPSLEVIVAQNMAK